MENSFVLSILSLLVFLNICYAKEYFTPCKASDPKLNECLKTVSAKVLPLIIEGIPELKLSPFDPFDIEDIHVTDLPSVKFHVLNGTVHGMKNLKIIDLKVDPKEKHLFLKYIVPGVLRSDYEIDGRILILPLNGKGKAVIKMDIDTEINMDYDIVKKKDGNDHWKIIKHQANFTPSNIDFNMTNLFSGNPQLESFGSEFLKQNSLEIFKEIGPPAMTVIIKRIVKQIGKFFAAFPAEQIMIP